MPTTLNSRCSAAVWYILRHIDTRCRRPGSSGYAMLCLPAWADDCSPPGSEGALHERRAMCKSSIRLQPIASRLVSIFLGYGASPRAPWPQQQNATGAERSVERSLLATQAMSAATARPDYWWFTCLAL